MYYRERKHCEHTFARVARWPHWLQNWLINWWVSRSKSYNAKCVRNVCMFYLIKLSLFVRSLHRERERDTHTHTHNLFISETYTWTKRDRKLDSTWSKNMEKVSQNHSVLNHIESGNNPTPTSYKKVGGRWKKTKNSVCKWNTLSRHFPIIPSL